MDVLKEFQVAIEIERQKNLEDFEAEKNLPLDDRVAKGVTMSNLKVAFEFHDDLPNQWCYSLRGSDKYISAAKISCDNNISKFKEGNPVLLSNGKHRFEMEIVEDSTENFMLIPNDFNIKSCYIDSEDYPRNNWEINTAKTDVTTRLLLSAAQMLKDNSTMLSRIDSFLNGKTKNSFRNYSQKVAYLNDSQNTAYLHAINASDFCLIQGPPGTGKTETIAFIVRYLLESGLNIFITAPTNTAINNCLNAISTKVRDSRQVVKIGDQAGNKEVQGNQNVMQKTRLAYATYLNNPNFSRSGIAIGATAYSLCYPASKKLDGWAFDVVIVDEASQLSIPLSVAAICRTSKFIFVGDHKQLDPIIPKKSNNEMFAESIFSRLARIYPNDINLLDTSYRLNEQLIKIPNALFYNNCLRADSTTNEDTSRYQCANHPEILNSDSHVLLLHHVFDSQGRSPFEAMIVAELVFDLINNNVDIRDIGVMSPYRAQVREMKKEIKKILPMSISNPFESLFVDTVDSMQGQERKYIIYSMSNSHPLESMRRLDFFYSPNRLNVAITRAIKKCIVIANYKIFDIKDEELSHHEEYVSIKESLHIFKRYFSISTRMEIKEKNEAEAW